MPRRQQAKSACARRSANHRSTWEDVYSSWSRGGPSGPTLDVYEPIATPTVDVAALEVGLPLTPILASTGEAQRDILIFVLGGALVVWLLALPFTATASVGIARSWLPGAAGS